MCARCVSSAGCYDGEGKPPYADRPAHEHARSRRCSGGGDTPTAHNSALHKKKLSRMLPGALPGTFPAPYHVICVAGMLCVEAPHVRPHSARRRFLRVLVAQVGGHARRHQCWQPCAFPPPAAVARVPAPPSHYTPARYHVMCVVTCARPPPTTVPRPPLHPTRLGSTKHTHTNVSRTLPSALPGALPSEMWGEYAVC